jgi:hypothetical protein
VFFDSLFPSYQSTTPESVISDYRNKTHHNNASSSARSNIEFYAEIVGKLIGTVRDGFSTLIDDVKKRKPNASVNQTNSEMQTVEKLKNHTSKIAKGSASMTNDSTDEIQSTQSLRLHLDMKNDTKTMNEIEEQELMPSWGNVVQKISKNKLKRSDSESELSFIATTDGEDEKFDFFDDDDDEMVFEVEKQSPSLLTALYERHRQRKQRLLASLCQLFSTEQEGDELILEPRNQNSKLTFAIMRGNSTVAQVTPKQFLGIFHRGSDEHAEFQKRAKRMLQEAFYKYARIYLRARKGYKDARNLNRKVRESTQVEENNEISSDARNGAKAVESFAIFVLEIFGAMAALTYGALNQLQNSSYSSL